MLGMWRMSLGSSLRMSTSGLLTTWAGRATACNIEPYRALAACTVAPVSVNLTASAGGSETIRQLLLGGGATLVGAGLLADPAEMAPKKRKTVAAQPASKKKTAGPELTALELAMESGKIFQVDKLLASRLGRRRQEALLVSLPARWSLAISQMIRQTDLTANKPTSKSAPPAAALRHRR